MSCPSKNQILNLYRNFMKYGENLKLTDRDFYYSRIKKEFSRKDLTTQEEIRKAYEVGQL